MFPEIHVLTAVLGAVTAAVAGLVRWEMHRATGKTVRVLQAERTHILDNMELLLYAAGMMVAHAFTQVLAGITDILAIHVFSQLLEYAYIFAVLAVLGRWTAMLFGGGS